MYKKRSRTDSMLREAIKISSNWSQVFKTLNLSASGSALASIKKKSVECGYDYSHFTKSPYYSRKAKPLNEILVENSTSVSNTLKERLFKEGIKERKCEKCKLTEWMGEPIPLQLDHINGIKSDNRLLNLRILCLNCHYQTPTWGMKNPNPTLYLCSECFVPINIRSKKCRKCANKSDRERLSKITWPSLEYLKERLKLVPYTILAKELGISDSAIRKHIKIRSKD